MEMKVLRKMYGRRRPEETKKEEQLKIYEISTNHNKYNDEA